MMARGGRAGFKSGMRVCKLAKRGKAAAKRKFKVYPSAYANAYASKICAGKIKDPSGVKRKDFRGSKAKGGRIQIQGFGAARR